MILVVNVQMTKSKITGKIPFFCVKYACMEVTELFVSKRENLEDKIQGKCIQFKFCDFNLD